MKKLKLMVKKTKSRIVVHRSLIFTIIEIVGVAGVSFVSYWTGKRVSEKIKELKEENPDISRTEIFKAVWLDLLPMFGSVTGVVVLICLNEKLTEREKAELVAAIASGAGSIEANKRKRKAEAEKTGDHSKDDWVIPVPGETEIPEGLEKEVPFDEWILCCDMYTGRCFWSTEDRVYSAEDLYTQILIETGQCGYNEWFNLLGIRTSQFGDEFGDCVAIDINGTEATMEGNIALTDPIFETYWAKTKNGQPILCIGREQEPMQDWYFF